VGFFDGFRKRRQERHLEWQLRQSQNVLPQPVFTNVRLRTFNQFQIEAVIAQKLDQVYAPGSAMNQIPFMKLAGASTVNPSGKGKLIDTVQKEPAFQTKR
jgi:hypothetical protein